MFIFAIRESQRFRTIHWFFVILKFKIITNSPSNLIDEKNNVQEFFLFSIALE